MKNSRASAPGKIILFGEHAVVYGRPAIAVPVNDVQAVATLTEAEPGAGFRLIAPDLGRDEQLPDVSPDDPLGTMIGLTLDYLERPEIPDAILTVRSTIPLGRGLGSGAAVSTAIARAIGQYFGRSLPPAVVSALVYDVEKLYHGTPSGIDNTVVAFNQPVYFIKGRPIRRLRVAQPLTLVIADTGVVAPTHKVVGDLRRRWQADPAGHERFFDAIGGVVEKGRALIETPAAGIAELGALMNENQTILRTIGVSSPELDDLVEAARRAGAMGAKLSGAGWGGNMIALATTQNAPAIAEALDKARAVNVIVTKVIDH
ncbi:MAG: mevalonate kinase [Anaerolineae bacterium]|nr:mevalonate kinase [Anaerolineae bacterium]